MIIIILVLLLAILSVGVWVLLLDAGTRRVKDQMTIALGPEIAAPPPIIVPQVRKDRSGWPYTLARVLFGYVPESHRYVPLWLTLVVALVIGVAVVLIEKMLVPLWIALPGGVASAGFAIRAVLSWERSRYAEQLLRQLPDTIQITTSAVKAGWPVGEAFRAVSREMLDPTREQFAIVVNEMDVGQRVSDALHGVYERSGVSEYAMLSVTLAVQASSGGRLAETLETLGDAIRERIALAGRAKALAGESRIASRVMTSLPFLVGGILYLLNPSFMDMMFEDSRGRAMLAIAVTMLVSGALWMRRMIKKGTTV